MLKYIDVYRMCKQAADSQRPLFHSIAAGDTIDVLGKKYDVSTKRFLAANPRLDPRKMQIGQKLNIPISDRDDIIQNYNFDPDVVNMPTPLHIWQQMMQESTLGQNMYPLKDPKNPNKIDTSVGPWQANKSAWTTVSKLYPDRYNGRQMSEMATDMGLAWNVYRDYMTEIGKRWQRRNKKPANSETMIRLWNSPADPYGAQGNKYWGEVSRHTLPDIHRALQKSPDNVYYAAYRKNRVK